jgi:hypothetical protein
MATPAARSPEHRAAYRIVRVVDGRRSRVPKAPWGSRRLSLIPVGRPFWAAFRIRPRPDQGLAYVGHAYTRRQARNIADSDRRDRPNMLKDDGEIKDTRYPDYRDEYGPQMYELDALEPRIISELIREAATELIDEDAWEEAQEREQAGQDAIAKIARHRSLRI